MNKISLIVILLLTSFVGRSQFFATDFTVEDCSGTTYNLFDELDEEKVIVMAWTMPCFSCIAPCVAAHEAVNSFSGTHPGRVEYYLVDDYADTDCATVEAWAAANGIVDVSAIFSNASIDMDDYGTPGMPKIVVLGCSSHKIFYNGNLSVNYDDIHAGISEALEADGCFSALPEEPTTEITLDLYPNPATDIVTVSYFLPTPSAVNLEIYSCTGELVVKQELNSNQSGNLSSELDVNELSEGVYFFKLRTNQMVETKKFIIGQ